MSPNQERVASEWKNLSEQEQEQLLPKLLLEMPGFRAWTDRPSEIVFWLGRTFENAQVPLFADARRSAKL